MEPAEEAFTLLRGIDVLVSMPDAAIREVAAAMSPVALSAGETLVRLGERADAMFVVAEGELEVRLPSAEGHVVLAVLGTGRGIGEMQMVSGGTRTATVVALGGARLYRLERTAFAAYAQRSPQALKAVIERVRERAHDAQAAALIPQVCGGLDPEALAVLKSRVRWIELKRGERLFQQGDPGDAWYIVASGRLEIVVAGDDGVERVVGESSRGDSVGELALLTGEPRAATLWAMRDSSLLRIDRADFESIVLQRPDVMLSIIRSLAQRIRAQGRVRARGFGQHFAVVGARPEVDVGEVSRRLFEAFSALGPTLYVNPVRLAEMGVMDNAASIDEAHPAWVRFLSWLDEQDQRHDFVVLEALPMGVTGDTSAWNTRCVRQADHVLLVADAAADPAPTPAEQALDEASKPRGIRRTLLLLHPDGARRPTGTIRWLETRKLDGHQHVRLDRETDFGRVARILAGRAVGLVLGGGGARGFAHIGVVRALQEGGVPLDWVGGTSMGSIIGGMVAMELTPPEMVERNEQIVRLKPFREFTLPIFAMLRTRRIEEGARLAFEEVRIEDLWLPYFCVSASLTSALEVVHEQGLLWEATRASGALPGIALPMLLRGALLVDGGVVNNLPGDVMRSRCRGKVIVVNVSPDVDAGFAIERLHSPWEVLWSWMSPFRTALTVPTIMHVIMRTATLASADRARVVQRDADLYLHPPITAYGLLDFERIHEIVDTGYRYAADAVRGWRP